MAQLTASMLLLLSAVRYLYHDDIHWEVYYIIRA